MYKHTHSHTRRRNADRNHYRTEYRCDKPTPCLPPPPTHKHTENNPESQEVDLAEKDKEGSLVN